MAKNFHSLLTFLLVASLAGCSSLSSEEPVDDGYPVFYRALETQELVELNEEYQQENSLRLCSTLNEYGFTGFSRVLFPGDINPCLNREELRVELPYSNQLLEQAKESLVLNNKYTRVIDSDLLTLKETISLDGCTICEGDINNVPLQWKFTFSSQSFNGVEVLDTEIIVYIDANGVNRIWGNWFELKEPGFIEIGSTKAKDSLIGIRLRYANQQNQVFEQEIATNHIKPSPLLAYSAIEVENGIEIHRVWEIEVLLNGTDEVKWKVYVSTQTGEVLHTKLL